MKIKNIIKSASLLAIFGGMAFTGCDESELYSAGAPDWIADSVSAVAARNAANAGESDAVSYGTLHETFTSNGWEFPKLHVEAQVGTWLFSSSDGKYTDEEIIGSGWWKAQSIDANADGSNWTSSDFELTDGKLVLTFVPQTENAVVMWEYYGNGYWTTISEGNWWYAEDALPENGGTGTGATSGYSYKDNGAYHFEVGSTVTLVITKSGSNYTAEVYYQKAPEFTPKSISVAGTPKAISYTEEEVDYNYYFGDATATVTWDNGAVSTVNAKDLTFTVVPDLKTVGTAIVTVAYGKTSKGNYCEPVSTGYKIEVAGEIESIKINPVSETPVYYYVPGTTEIKKEDIDVVSYIKSVVGVAGTTELPLGEDSYTTEVTIPANFGDDIAITVKYKDFSTTLNVAVKEMESEEISLADWGTLGNEDNTSGWWAAHSPADYKLESGKGIIFKFNNYGGQSNWNNWVLILRSAAGDNGNTPAGAKEYIVGRADNWCWGTGFTDDPADALESSEEHGITKESNGAGNDDWQSFKTALQSGVECTMEIINKGTTADAICTWTYNNVNYYQKYLNIPKDAGDLYIDFTIDGCHLVFK